MIFLACYYKIFKGPKNLPRKKSTHKSFCCVSFKKHNGDMPNQFEATLVDRHLPSTVAEHDDLRHGLRIPSCYFSQVKSSMGVILLESHLPGAPASGLTEKNIYIRVYIYIYIFKHRVGGKTSSNVLSFLGENLVN